MEMGPRDGLQNEAMPAPYPRLTDSRLVESGLQRIEVGAFVSPRRVPQMADSAELFKACREGDNPYGALVPNLQGLQAAMPPGLTRLSVHRLFRRFYPSQYRHRCGGVTGALRPSGAGARSLGIKVRVYLSTVIACPLRWPDPPERVGPWPSDSLIRCHEISLGDTIGVGTPARSPPCWMLC